MSRIPERLDPLKEKTEVPVERLAGEMIFQHLGFPQERLGSEP
jgi:hypothetical protein